MKLLIALLLIGASNCFTTTTTLKTTNVNLSPSYETEVELDSNKNNQIAETNQVENIEQKQQTNQYYNNPVKTQYIPPNGRIERPLSSSYYTRPFLRPPPPPRRYMPRRPPPPPPGYVNRRQQQQHYRRPEQLIYSKRPPEVIYYGPNPPPLDYSPTSGISQPPYDEINTSPRIPYYPSSIPSKNVENNDIMNDLDMYIPDDDPKVASSNSISSPAGIGGGGLLASFMMPLMMLGLSIPALGFMFTYFSKRRRRRDVTTRRQLQLNKYMDLLLKALQDFDKED